MNDLTIALSALGGVVLAGVLAHGVWQARRAGPKRAEPPEPTGELREPVMGDAPDTIPIDPASLSHDGPVGEAADGGEPSEPRGGVKRYQPRLDALIDALVPIVLENPISGDAVHSHLPPTRRAGSKPFMIEGLNLDTQEWEPPAAHARYRELQAGVQLANRTGALNEIEYSEFVQKVQAFAEGIGGMADFPDMLDVVARARELDGFASQYDAQLAVHLRARGAAWTVGYIQQHAAQQGFVVGLMPGRLQLPGSEEGAPPVLLLSFDSQAALAEDPNQTPLRDLTLSFDVPQTAAAAEPFATWRNSAQALAADMDAVVVDDNGQPLAPQSFDGIGTELVRLYEALDARDLAAGSMAARRLFS